MRGTSLLSQLLTSVVFKLDASYVIGLVLIQASQLGIEVEAFRKAVI